MLLQRLSIVINCSLQLLHLHEASFSSPVILVKLLSQALGKRNISYQKDKANPTLLYSSVLENLKSVASGHSGDRCSWSFWVQKSCVSSGLHENTSSHTDCLGNRSEQSSSFIFSLQRCTRISPCYCISSPPTTRVQYQLAKLTAAHIPCCNVIPFSEYILKEENVTFCL